MKRLLLLITVLSLISCEKNSDTYKIDGNAIGFEDGTAIYVYTVTNNNQSKIIDTLVVNNGTFLGEYPNTDALTINFLRAEKSKGNVLFFPENTDLKITMYKDSISSSFTVGGKQNESSKAFYSKMKEFNQQKTANIERFKIARREKDNELATKIQQENKIITAEQSNFKKQFVTENTNSLFTVLLLSEMVSRKELTPSEATVVIDKLSPKVASNSSISTLKGMISSMKKADVGGKAPNFSATTPEGETLALNDVLGKYTLIDFWASWCGPCRRENPNVVKVYNKYHDKGFNIISVSLDKPEQKDRWLKAIEKDQMNWNHISNLKGWNDPIAKQYSVRSIPATFLLDENGNIIAKNLRGAALDAKIASLLDN